MKRLASILAMWLSIAHSSSAADVYVDNVAGDDTHLGTTELNIGASGPVRTIAKALRLADTGDRVILLKTNQPYRESVSLVGVHHSGTATLPFEIVGNGNILDGSQPIPPDCWSHVSGDVFRFHPPRKAFQMLFHEDRPLPRGDAEQGLKANEWDVVQGQILFRVEPKRSVYQYQLSCAAMPVGITLYRVDNVRITNLTIQGYQQDGINALDGVRDCQLANVRLRGNARSGLSVGGVSEVTVLDGLLGNNGVAQLRTEGASVTRLIETTLLENTAPAVDQQGGEILQLER